MVRYLGKSILLFFESILKLFLTMVFLDYSKVQYSLPSKTIYFMLFCIVIWIFREPTEYYYKLLNSLEND